MSPVSVLVGYNYIVAVSSASVWRPLSQRCCVVFGSAKGTVSALFGSAKGTVSALFGPTTLLKVGALSVLSRLDMEGSRFGAAGLSVLLEVTPPDATSGGEGPTTFLVLREWRTSVVTVYNGGGGE